jgi:uroporphyrinogen-III decarboxylase
LLTAAGDDPEAFADLVGRYNRWIMPAFDALARSRVPVAMIHDDFVWSSGPIFAPDWYRRHVMPHYHQASEMLAESGKRVLFTADGDFTLFLEDLVKTRIHTFVMEPMTDMAQLAARHGKTHGFIGNADTRILLSGTPRTIHQEVERCMAIGKSCPGFVLAVGNHLPPNTPVPSALAYQEAYLDLRGR